MFLLILTHELLSALRSMQEGTHPPPTLTPWYKYITSLCQHCLYFFQWIHVAMYMYICTIPCIHYTNIVYSEYWCTTEACFHKHVHRSAEVLWSLLPLNLAIVTIAPFDESPE